MDRGRRLFREGEATKDEWQEVGEEETNTDVPTKKNLRNRKSKGRKTKKKKRKKKKKKEKEKTFTSTAITSKATTTRATTTTTTTTAPTTTTLAEDQLNKSYLFRAPKPKAKRGREEDVDEGTLEEEEEEEENEGRGKFADKKSRRNPLNQKTLRGKKRKGRMEKADKEQILLTKEDPKGSLKGRGARRGGGATLNLEEEGEEEEEKWTDGERNEDGGGGEKRRKKGPNPRMRRVGKGEKAEEGRGRRGKDEKLVLRKSRHYQQQKRR